MSDSDKSLPGSLRGAASALNSAARLTDLRPLEDTAASSSPSKPEPPSSLRALRLPLLETDSPTPAPRCGDDVSRRQIVSDEKGMRSAYPTAPVALSGDAQHPHNPLDGQIREHENVSTLLVPRTSAPHNSSTEASVGEDKLSPSQKERVAGFRDKLVNLFEAPARHPLLRSDMMSLAEDFAFILGQFADCSDLFEAVPSDGEDVTAPQPIPDPTILHEVRTGFLKMAPHVTSHLQHPSRMHYPQPHESWNLPQEAHEDPIEFWTKVWDSFDFSAPQYFDTTLELDKQPRDAAMYFITWDHYHEVGSNLSYGMRNWHRRETTEDLDENHYILGREFFRDQLSSGFGINIRPRRHEPAVPFPWLDRNLSRFKSLGWKYILDHDDEAEEIIWKVDYNDEEKPYDPLHRTVNGKHFSPFSWLNLLVTNVRVPLPRRVLQDPAFLSSVMQHVYNESHPLQMMGEARMLVCSLRGDIRSDADLRAAMLYQLVSRLAKADASFFARLLHAE